MKISFGHGGEAMEAAADEYNFPIHREPTRFAKKDYVINSYTGDVLGIVGRNQAQVSHAQFFHPITEAIEGRLGHSQQRTWVSRHGAWALREYVFPHITSTVETARRSSEVQFKALAWHGVDGLTSNNFVSGSILMWCLNTMVLGEDITRLRRKNTKNFSMENFVETIDEAHDGFSKQIDMLRRMANSPMLEAHGEQIVRELSANDVQAEAILSSYHDHRDQWGDNAFALYNTWTNWATYADDRNGSVLRRTSNDNTVERLHRRSFDVAQWAASERFQLALAA
tara:strand:- start:592 stop:1440 length:849 start_codon:yes stop_codon:yes gene_type:complete